MNNKIAIKNFATVTNGKSDVKDAVENGKYFFFDRSNIIKKSDKYLFDTEAIIIPGEDSREIFEPRYFKGKFNLHQRCYVIYNFSDDHYPKYLFYKLKTLTKHFANVNVGSTVPSLRLDHITDLAIDFPCYLTQKTVANTLYNIDAKIDLNNQINQELEAMAKLLYDYWFVQFDFPNEEGKPYKSSGGKMVYNEELKREIPEGWKVKKAREFIFQVSESIKPYEFPELPYLPIDKLPMKQLYYSEYEKRSEAKSSLIRFKEDDILLGAMRVYFHRVCNAISDGISRSTMMVLRPYQLNHKNFALFTLNKEEAIEYATNNSTGSSIPYAKWNYGLENYKVALPENENILDFFDSIVNPILEQFKILNKQNQHLAELRDWLLPMLMNGQIKVESTEEAEEEFEETLGGGDVAEPSIKY